jgi:hypothetical protein
LAVRQDAILIGRDDLPAINGGSRT